MCQLITGNLRSDDVSNNSPNETVKLEDNHIDGDVGIVGIGNSEDENNDKQDTSYIRPDG